MREIPQFTAAVSRWLIRAYIGVAVLNLLIFIYGGWHVDNLSVAVLFVVLIGAQKNVEAWRESALSWRRQAELWQQRAEERWRL